MLEKSVMMLKRSTEYYSNQIISTDQIKLIIAQNKLVLI